MTKYQDQPVLKEARDLLAGEKIYQQGGKALRIIEVRDNGIFTSVRYIVNGMARNRVYRSYDAVHVIMPLDKQERISKKRKAS